MKLLCKNTRLHIRDVWRGVLEECVDMDNIPIPEVFRKFGKLGYMGIRNDVNGYYKLNAFGCLALALDRMDMGYYTWRKAFASETRKDWHCLRTYPRLSTTKYKVVGYPTKLYLTQSISYISYSYSSSNINHYLKSPREIDRILFLL